MRRLPLALALFATACDPSPRSSPPAVAQSPAPPPAHTPPPSPPAPRAPVTPVYIAEAVRRIAHTPDAFTQGLAFHGSRLFESTGLNGQSSVRELDPLSGRVMRRRDVAEEHFAEGLTVFNGRIFQITWRSQRAFVYELDTFRPVAEHTYVGEGWGLTHDGHNLILSDGTARLRFFDPTNFSEQRWVRVRDGERSIDQLNELEMIDGEVWANLWHEDRIARINPANGRVVAWVDASALHASLNLADPEAVLNGIAFEPETRRIILTGKNWPAMFEIRLRRVGGGA